MATRERPAFYAIGGGRAGELMTLLHPPYTAWHLSYFALGAAAAPKLYADRCCGVWRRSRWRWAWRRTRWMSCTTVR